MSGINVPRSLPVLAPSCWSLGDGCGVAVGSAQRQAAICELEIVHPSHTHRTSYFTFSPRDTSAL